MIALPVVSVVVLAYLIGGLPFGLLVARAYGVRDIRRHGSGNIGATNVWRVIGPQAAVWVYLLDIGKGVLAVGLARLVSQAAMPRDLFLVLAALAAVLGHVFSPYLNFKGGKGVNTGLGVMVMLLPLETLVALVVFVAVVAVFRYISLGSIIAGLALAASVVIEREVLHKDVSVIYLGLTMILAAVLIFTHRHNIRRLSAGTESRFTLSTRRRGGRE